MNSELKLIESFLQEQVVPIANKIDRDPETLKLAFNKMGKHSWLALKVDSALGGTGLTETEYRCLQISMARASGALTFLQTQHQSAVSKLAQSDNQSLQQLVPDAATGRVTVGVGFSHLRRRGKPMMQARPTTTGYLLTGKVPWITGYKFFDYFIVGATLPDGRELYGLVPFQNQSSKMKGKINFGEPMELMAVAATNTVSAEIEEWFLDRARLVAINPPGAIHVSSRRNILNHGFFALGCAYAALDLLEKIAQKKQLDFLDRSRQALEQEVTKNKSKAIASMSDLDISYQQKLQLRIQSIDLAQRCSLAAVIASSGAANYLHSDVARIYREALLFSVSGQTTDVMEGSLNLLTH